MLILIRSGHVVGGEEQLGFQPVMLLLWPEDEEWQGEREP